MAANNFLVFAGSGGANVLTQAAYAALSSRSTGFSSGTAKSIELNKVWRQSSIMSSALAQAIGDITGIDILDDGTIAPIVIAIKAAMKASSLAVVGEVRNFKCVNLSTNATITLTGDQVIAQTALGGNSFRCPSFSKTLNLTLTGAGGRDTAFSAVSKYIASYAIYNPTTDTWAALGVDATTVAAPEICAGTMPAGYTASCLLSVLPTDASGLFIPFLAQDRHVRITPNAFYPATSTQQPTLFIRDCSAAVPLNAKTGDFSTTISTTAVTVTVANALAGSPAVVGSFGIGEKGNSVTSGNIAGAGFPSQYPDIPIITPQTIYYRCTVASGTMSFSISCNGYTI